MLVLRGALWKKRTASHFALVSRVSKGSEHSAKITRDRVKHAFWIKKTKANAKRVGTARSVRALPDTDSYMTLTLLSSRCILHRRWADDSINRESGSCWPRLLCSCCYAHYARPHDPLHAQSCLDLIDSSPFFLRSCPTGLNGLHLRNTL